MITAGYAKDQRWFAPAYIWIVNNTKSKRAVVALISGITGVLPITGRVAVSAGFLDTIAPKDKEKRKRGEEKRRPLEEEKKGKENRNENKH